ncbi:MAG: glycosyltransferase family protein [Rikenellaceae bacterium]
MKYIFVIQGEGRGHLTQALALSELLREAGHVVEDVLVGRCQNRELPTFFTEKINANITRYDSPTFDLGSTSKRGSSTKTVASNIRISNLQRWFGSSDIIANKIEESDADVVINFYEVLLGATKMLRPITKPIRKPIISIGHQFLIEHPKFKSPHKSEAALLSMTNRVCSYGSIRRLALSFYPMKYSPKLDIEVVPPLLRPQIFEQQPSTGDFTLGYMLNPGYLDEVLEWKSRHPEAKVHLFWDKQGAAECEERVKGLWLHKINDVEFLQYMSSCRGYITTAGFESVCEALYLGKPVLMIPAHIEQQINAADAELVGAGATASKFNLSLLEGAIKKYSADTKSFRAWVDSAREVFLKTLTNI